MKLTHFVMFNLRKHPVEAIRRVLADVDLSSEAKIVETDFPGNLCSLTLDEDDPRLPRLLAALERVGLDPFIRIDRKFTSSEIETADWLRLKVATAGLSGGYNLGQEYDTTNACPVCGSGAMPVPPLLVDLPKMGKKLLDRTAHDGHLVVRTDVVQAMLTSGITGFELLPVVQQSARMHPSDEFVWLRPTSSMPPMTGANLTLHDPCDNCGRAGHFDSIRDPVQFAYGQMPEADISFTWEYFGRWRHPMKHRNLYVGGAREVVASRRLRDLLAGLRVRSVRWDPVLIHGSGT